MQTLASRGGKRKKYTKRRRNPFISSFFRFVSFLFSVEGKMKLLAVAFYLKGKNGTCKTSKNLNIWKDSHLFFILHYISYLDIQAAVKAGNLKTVSFYLYPIQTTNICIILFLFPFLFFFFCSQCYFFRFTVWNNCTYIHTYLLYYRSSIRNKITLNKIVREAIK